MSSCLSGGRTYGFDLSLSTSLRSSQTSSPSSTISESSNSPIAISTRKPRTPRKRPNQTYNEAAVLLSTAYPNIFSIKHIPNPSKFSKPCGYFSDESSELMLPFRVIDDSGFLLHTAVQEKHSFRIQSKVSNFSEKLCQSPAEIEPQSNYMELCNDYQEDFDTESILDEEIEEGIDSIMGNLCVDNDMASESFNPASSYTAQISCYGNPMGLGFGGKFQFGFGLKQGTRALRHVDDGNWWNFPTVDVQQISPKLNKVSIPAQAPSPAPANKKKKKVEKPVEAEQKNSELSKENPIPKPEPSRLLLKLNYDAILNAWSDKESPITIEEVPGLESAGSDLHARLAQIDLFSESGGVREASVLRYKEKRRTRLFSKKIRYQVRKVNADRRPRMKGRFVRRPNTSNTGQRGK